MRVIFVYQMLLSTKLYGSKNRAMPGILSEGDVGLSDFAQEVASNIPYYLPLLSCCHFFSCSVKLLSLFRSMIGMYDGMIEFVHDVTKSKIWKRKYQNQTKILMNQSTVIKQFRIKKILGVPVYNRGCSIDEMPCILYAFNHPKIITGPSLKLTNSSKSPSPS